MCLRVSCGRRMSTLPRGADGHAEPPPALVVVHLHEDAVDAGAQRDGDLVVAGAVGAADLAGMDLLAVEPDANAVVAAAAEQGSAGGGAFHFRVAVRDGPFGFADCGAEVEVTFATRASGLPRQHVSVDRVRG